MGLVQKAFSDIITFSRSSNATRVGPTGVLEYAPHNLLVRSQEFDNASWTKAAGATVTANSIAAPDGTITADLVATDFIYQGSLTYSVATFSVYVKAGTSTDSFVYMDNSGAKFCRFNATTGVITATASGYSSSITSVGNGWYRITFTGQISGACGFGQNGSGNGYFWGAQLSVGPYALDYTPTTSAAVYGPRFDYNGSGVTIVEPVSRNLFLYSEDVASWSGYSTGPTITSNSATSPVGTQTADRVVLTAFDFIYQRYLNPVAGSYCYSVWIRADANTTVYFRVTDSGVPSVAALSVSVTTSWQRITVPINLLTSSSQVDAGLDQRAAVGGPGTSATVYLWGAQFEPGSTATGYMFSGATNGFRAVPVVSGSATARGLLVEESRSNLVTYSEDFSNAAWVAYLASKTANFATAPNGTITANRIAENAANSLQAIYNTISTSTTGARTVSVFAKAAERSFFRVSLSGVGATEWFGATFDLQNGTVTQQNAGAAGTVSGATITAFGSGWYRCTVTGDTGSTGVTYAYLGPALTGTPSAGSFGVLTYSGNSSNGVLAWGAQLEAGSFATSYIPTVASTVTRSADVASVNTLSPWFNASAGTLYAEGSTNGYNAGRLVSLSDSPGSASTVQSINFETTGLTRVYQVSGSLNFDFAPGAYTPQAIVKMAGRFNASNYAGVQNGGAVSTSSNSTTPPTMVYMALGALTSNSFYLNGHLRRVAYYPRALTNAELQALTA